MKFLFEQRVFVPPGSCVMFCLICKHLWNTIPFHFDSFFFFWGEGRFLRDYSDKGTIHYVTVGTVTFSCGKTICYFQCNEKASSDTQTTVTVPLRFHTIDIWHLSTMVYSSVHVKLVHNSSHFFGVQTWKRQSFIKKQPSILGDLLARLLS